MKKKILGFAVIIVLLLTSIPLGTLGTSHAMAAKQSKIKTAAHVILFLNWEGYTSCTHD